MDGISVEAAFTMVASWPTISGPAPNFGKAMAVSVGVAKQPYDSANASKASRARATKKNSRFSLASRTEATSSSTVAMYFEGTMPLRFSLSVS